MRLFYALTPSPAMIDVVQPIMHGVSGARWQTAAQLHLTLRFIGDVTPRIADELADALPMLVPAVPPAAFSGVGFFEGKRHPNALWVCAAPKEPLALLHRKLDRACQIAGLEPERRAYIPHMTLARLSASAGPVDRWIADHAGFTTTPLPFARCSLVESIPTDHGSHYAELAGVELI